MHRPDISDCLLRLHSELCSGTGLPSVPTANAQEIHCVFICRSWSYAEAESYLTGLLSRALSQRGKQQVGGLVAQDVYTQVVDSLVPLVDEWMCSTSRYRGDSIIM